MKKINKIIIVFCTLSFALTIDYSLALITVQAYWVSSGGKEKLAGLIFGIYDMSTIIVSPLLALYLCKNGSYKIMFLTSLVMNMIGNIIYILPNIFNLMWELILVGRLIAGIGASSLPLIMVYIAENMSMEEQSKAIGYSKYTSAVSRVVGPLFGILFTIIINFKGTLGQIVNMYSLVGWIPIIIDIITFFIVLIFFTNVRASCDYNTSFNIKLIVKNFWPILVVGFISTALYWMFMGNSYIIATHYFKIINNEHQLYRIYISGFFGFIISFIIFMLGRKYLSDIYGLILSNVILVIGIYIFLPNIFCAFYVAVGISTFAYGLMIPSLNIINNQMGKMIKNELKSYLPLVLIMLTIVQSVARFCGPALFTSYTHLDEEKNCDFRNKNNYITKGCNIDNYVLENALIIGICALITFISIYMLHRNFKYLKNDTEQKQLLINKDDKV